MASQVDSSQEPSDALEMEKRVDQDESCATSPLGHGSNGELDGIQGPEAKAASSMPPSSTVNLEPEWAHGFQLFSILTAVTFVTFLMLLDGTIVVAAVPRITDDFNSLNDIGWYGAAYQLGRCVDLSFEHNESYE